MFKVILILSERFVRFLTSVKRSDEARMAEVSGDQLLNPVATKETTKPRLFSTNALSYFVDSQIKYFVSYCQTKQIINRTPHEGNLC